MKRIRYKLVVLSLLLVCCFASWAFAYVNLLTDPSFENSAWDEKWYEGSGNCSFNWEENVAHTGTRSCSISNFSGSGTGIWCSGGRNVPGGKSYFLSVWVKIDNLTSGNVQIKCYENGGNGTSFSRKISQTADWQQISLPIVVPDSTTAVVCSVLANALNPEAKVYFDDVAIFEVPKTELWSEFGTHWDGFDGIYLKPDATGGFLNYQPAGTPQWGGMIFDIPSNFSGLPNGDYKYEIRYYGDPLNDSGQEFYLNRNQSIAQIPTYNDGKYHYAAGTFTVENNFEAPTVKKIGDTNKGTNPIDWIWIGPVGTEAPEGQMMITDKPGNLTATYTGPYQVKLTWGAPQSNSGVAVYQVYRGLHQDFALAEGEIVANTKETSYTETLDPRNKFYYYKVLAWNEIFGGFGSVPSDELSVRSDNIKPNKPQDFAADKNEIPGLVILSWQPPVAASDNELASEFRIYRAEDTDPFGETPYLIIDKNNPLFAADPNQTISWQDRRTIAGKSYRYAIVAVDDDENESELVEISSVVPLPDSILPNSPLPPEGTNALGVDENEFPGGICLSWRAPDLARDGDGAEQFVIYRASVSDPQLNWQTSGARWVVPAQGGIEEKYIDGNVTPGEIYYYAVASLDKSNNESADVIMALAGISPKPALAPVPTSPTQNAGIVDFIPKFEWKAPETNNKILGYKLRLAKSADMIDASETDLIVGTQYTYPRILEQGTWYWQVQIVYEHGIAGLSQVAEFTSINNGEAGLSIAYFEASPKVFNPDQTKLYLNFVLKEDSNVTVKIYDLRGRLIKTLIAGEFKEAKDQQGQLRNHQLTWDGQDNGKVVTRGIYYLHLEAKMASGRPIRIVRRFQVVR